jgi:hypothetical protein
MCDAARISPGFEGERGTGPPICGDCLLAIFCLYKAFAYLLLKENNMNKPIFQRIIDKLKIDQVTKCWNWQGSCVGTGYGRIHFNGTYPGAHCVMYQIFYGSIPEDKPLVLHHCDNPKCCNPLHLYAGTRQDNMDDMVKRKRNTNSIGENNQNAKLTGKQVLEIRASQDLLRVLANRYHVGITAIHNIKARKRWQHL